MQMKPKIVIAVDLDDVLCATNELIAKIHNDVWGTDFTLKDFEHYIWWRNRGWGNVEETVRKVKRIYQEHKPFERVKPIEGGRKACEGLKRQGYILVIVTSRESIRARETKAWLDAYFPDVFESIYLTGGVGNHGYGQGEVHAVDGCVFVNSKLEALHTCKARYLIDDAAENVIDINDVDKSIRILLFGDYEWNKRISRARTDHEDDFKSYGQRKVEGVQSEMVDEDDLKERGIVRVKDWKQVLEHILEERQREIADV